ncbi:Osc7112_2153 family protein [Microcoleus sp. herbarium7]
MELSPASKALSTPVTVTPAVNESVETLFKSNQSRWRRCRDRDGGNYPCPRFVMPSESEE